MIRYAVYCYVVSGLLLAAAHAAPIVKDVVVRTDGGAAVDTSFVRAHTSVQEGQALDRVVVSRDVRALLETGRFSYVGAEAEVMGDDAVRIIYVLKRRWLVAEPVRFSGFESLSENKVKRLFGVEQGDRVDEQLLNVGRSEVEAEYRKEFFRDAKVSWRTEMTDEDAGLVRIVLTAEEGRKARVRRIEYNGNDSIPTSTFRKIVRRPAWWNPFRVFIRRRYDAALIESIRIGVRDVYQNRGFLDAQVEVQGPVPDESGTLVLVVNIEEGMRYQFGSLELAGVSTFPEGEVAKEIKAQPGEIASQGEIDRSAGRIRDYFGSRGYINTRVEAVRTPDPENAVCDIVFEVTEGARVRIGNIHIRGNTRTRDKVIRRELTVNPGDIYNEVKVRRSERRLRNLNFFEQVRSYPGLSRAADQRDLVIEVDEKRTGQFMMGAGFSSVDNLVGFVELSQGNFDLMGWPYFTGGGQKLNLRAQWGSQRQHYQLSFTEPWFMNRRLSLGFELYLSDLNYSDYDLEKTGGAISLGKALPGPNRVDMKYRLEEVKISSIADTNEYVFADDLAESYFFDQEEDTTKSSLTLSFTHDTRDNPFFPRRGNRMTLSGTMIGGLLGMDTDVYTYSLRSAHYQSVWFGHVLSLKMSYQVAEAFGDTDEVPISERLFLGGGRTLRGFKYRDVGPKVVRTTSSGDLSYRPVGGQTLAMASVEYGIPLVEGIRLAGFYDVGNVWASPGEADFGELASSAGVGIRFDMPGFPIRIDRAWVMEADDELTSEDDWVIWIGYDY